jgi:molybdopterin molybdotransferase
MISIQEALEAISKNVPEPNTERVAMIQARDRILAESILAGYDSPTYTNSAMDGFAVKWDDVKPCLKGEKVALNIVGESQAGVPYPGVVQSGDTIRISTGAMMAESVDSVVPIEDCEVADSKIIVNSVKKANQHVRYQGEEFKVGTPLMDRGIKIGAAHIALMASMGLAEVQVYRKPKVAIIITGKELVGFDEVTEDHTLRDSNTPMLGALVERHGGELAYATRVVDDLNDTIRAIEAAQKKAEIVLLSGGVSMGIHDHVRSAAESCGYTQVFWKVDQKPGKPLFFARSGAHLILGLPGNPVSAFMCFQHYARPLLRAATGRSFQHESIRATLADSVINRGIRPTMMRVVLKRDPGSAIEALSLTLQGSHMLSSVAMAHGYFLIGGQQELEKGTEVDVIEF